MQNCLGKFDLVAGIALDYLFIFHPNKNEYAWTLSCVDQKISSRLKAPFHKPSQHPEPLFILFLDNSLKDRFSKHLFIVLK